jgi:hypothetical protein
MHDVLKMKYIYLLFVHVLTVAFYYVASHLVAHVFKRLIVESKYIIICKFITSGHYSYSSLQMYVFRTYHNPGVR